MLFAPRRLLAAAVVSALSLTGCVAEPPGETEAYPQGIIGGTTTSCVPSAGLISLYTPNGTLVPRTCSGVLVAPDLVMTAAHCAVLANVGGPDPSTVTFGGRTSTVSAAYVHPQYDGCVPGNAAHQAERSQNDVAFLRLATPVRRVIPARIGNLPAAGTEVRIVGNGATAAGGGVLDRRLGTFMLDAADSTGLLRMHGVDAGVCPGDSGAPVLVGGDCSGREPPTVVGVVSAGTWDGTACTTGSNLYAASATTGPGTLDFAADVVAGRAMPSDLTPPRNCCDPDNPPDCAEDPSIPPACGTFVCMTCSPGHRECLDYRLTDRCVGRVAPPPEICANGLDDDCDAATPDACDPCAGSADPCCGSADPCCGSADPCCGSADPCCGSSDPSCGTACEGVSCAAECSVVCCGDSCVSDADCGEGDSCVGCRCEHTEVLILDPCTTTADCAPGETCWMGGCRGAGEIS